MFSQDSGYQHCLISVAGLDHFWLEGMLPRGWDLSGLPAINGRDVDPVDTESVENLFERDERGLSPSNLDHFFSYFEWENQPAHWRWCAY